MDKISIITPVYNSEKYLKNCIDSIIKQNYENWELILVDDGSTDKSGYVCDEYSQKDKRIKTIHISNNGVSAARNEGIKHITGQYIMFIDSDDYIEKDAFVKLLNVSKKYDADIVMFNYNKLYENGRVLNQAEYSVCNTVMNREEAIKNTYIYGGTLWNKFIRARILIDNGICFNQELKASEDWMVLLQLICNGSRFVYIEDKLYNYIVRENSISRNDSLQKLLEYNKNAVKGLEECIGYLNKNLIVASPYIQASIVQLEIENILHLTKYKEAKKRDYILLTDVLEKYIDRCSVYIRIYIKLIKIHPMLFKIVWSLKNVMRIHTKG